jgi:hypothetical protein
MHSWDVEAFLKQCQGGTHVMLSLHMDLKTWSSKACS